MKENKIINLIKKINSLIIEEKDNDTLLDLIDLFTSERFDFLYKEFIYELKRKIASNNIKTQTGDFIALYDNRKGIIYCKCISYGYANEFDTSEELREKIKNKSFDINVIQLLQSGQLPKREHHTSTAKEKDIIKILRGFKPFNEKEQKEVFKKLQITEDDIKNMDKAGVPIIIENSSKR